ncbi:FAD-binding oxidoreductase [Pantoea sp. Nvir]|uniref:D-2-hydroxyglutarate dehydrogenase YdiJ n=1 Tax=Pantoea sp. Nvir TaxID=2576760 RepID=UPI0013589010|nr:FAD-binding and (Fe-S)-binding domain-containing protein [Pantoea sp. Nvir]MXP66208.1 FAD-binding oxidoreductase [Pantoea sp. Nvir]
MIPQISHVPNIVQLVATFLEALKAQGFTGDTATSYADRLIMSTDNSIYQLLPAAVLFPRSTEDVVLIARVACEESFNHLIFTPRGGGTGTNGQPLNQGIIVDMSRYMNRILEFNPEERWVRVEAGVIKDQLNVWLKPYGFFFSPELSTSNRATLGGMINTDASGQGSLVHGKTSDHVLGLRAVVLGGEVLNTQPMATVMAEKLAREDTLEGRLYQKILTRCREQRALILEKFPKLNRFLTGYDLLHVFSEDMQTFDLTRILCGAEGTLAFITEALLDITPLPKVRRLVNIKYDSFDLALRNAPFIVEANALSVETLDSTVLNLARKDIVWHSVRNLITDVPDKVILGLNIVEFAGDDEELIEQQISLLCAKLDALIVQRQEGVIGYQICQDLEGIELIYNMRKKAVGLLGNAEGRAKPIPFVEDTVVPPENLADYIVAFRKLLDTYRLSYGIFGHIDAGVLHVRPALDMCDPQHERLIKILSDEVVALTIRYGGLLWGEHGKGFRAQYSPVFFGETLFNELRHIKAAFDPENRMNPGKICTPVGRNETMMQVDGVTRGTYDRRIPFAVRNDWRGAIDCNGNGLCFNFDAHSPMCPSMKITCNRIQSPKGRASLTREWLRLLAEQNVNLQQLEKQLQERTRSLWTFIGRVRNSWHASKGEYDFSHEVYKSMVSCLACKACSTQCPIKIDVPNFRSRFLQLYHTRYLRPVSDYIVANVESYIPIIAKAPKIFNFFLRRPWIRKFSKNHIGMVDLPSFSSPSLQQVLRGHSAVNMTLEKLEVLNIKQLANYVLVVQDPFTSFYEARLIADFIRLIDKLGLHPVLLPFMPNGKAQHVKGFLQRFASTAGKTADFLNRAAKLGIPMVGVDPATVLCYRDEYKQMLCKKRRGDFHIQLVHEWLYDILSTLDIANNKSNIESWYLFAHCTEVTTLPNTPNQWQEIFSRFGAKLENINVGCCGMAGTYGHESKNFENSMGIYGLSWHPRLQNLPSQRCLATGFSCRNQVKRVEGNSILHPLQVLLKML